MNAQYCRYPQTPKPFTNECEETCSTVLELKALYKEKLMETELINDQLQKTIQEVNEANQGKTQFLTNISHDLKTPLNGIIGSIEILKNVVTTIEQQELTHIIKRSSENLLNTINNIIEFTKLSKENYQSKEEPFDLFEIVEEVMNMVEPQAQEKNLPIFYTPHPHTNRYLIGDPQAIKQVLINLTQNAIKFTEDGEIHLKIKTDTEGEWQILQVGVKDTGIGIPIHQQSAIFNNFYQTDISNTRTHTGSGIGLTICQTLIQAMHGNMALVSGLGKGSEFKFMIPLRKDYTKLEPQHNLAGKTITIIDDNKSQRNGLEANLQYAGAQTTSCSIYTPELIQKCQTDFVLVMIRLSNLEIFELEKISNQTKAKIILERHPHEFKKNPKGVTILLKPLKYTQIWNILENTFIPEKKGIPNLVEKKFLIVEDTPTNQKILSKILEKTNATIDIANNGQEAVEYCKTTQYDTIFMDIQMPVMDGFEATKVIRTQTKEKEPFIIALSAGIGTEDEYKKNGMDNFIPKPINPKKIYEILS